MSAHFSRVVATLAVFLACTPVVSDSAASTGRNGRASAPQRPAAARDDAARDEAMSVRLAAAIDSGAVALASALADSAVTLRQKSGPALAVASYIDSLGIRFFALGTREGWSAAEQLFLRSLAIKERSLGPDDLKVALTLGALGSLSERLGKWEEAATRIERVLAIRRRQLGPADPAVASSMRQLGMLRFQLGQYLVADSLASASLAIFESLPGDFAERIADGLNNLGEIRRVQDDYAVAEEYFRRGIAIARAKVREDAPLRAALINNLAGLYRDLSRFADAEPLLEESRDLREKSKDSSAEALATAELNLAEVYRLQGRNDEAAPLYARALAIARPALGNDNPSLTLFVNQAAVSFEESGRLTEAEPLMREALSLSERALAPDHPLVAQSLNDLARLLTRRGAFVEAESAYRRAAQIRAERLGVRHPDVAASRVDLARCLSVAPGRGDAAALVELEPAIAVLTATHTYPESRLDAYALRSAIRSRAGLKAGALADLGLALDALDSLRAQRGGGDATRAAFVARHLDLYHRMVELRLDAGDVDRALETHERGRARVLRDQLAGSGADLRAGIPQAERAPLEREEDHARAALARAQRALDAAWARGDLGEGERRARIAALESARDSAAWRFQRAGESIKDRSPLWRRMLTANGQPATRAEVQRTLERGELLLVYHVGDSDSWVFALSRTGKAAAWPLTVDAEAARELGIPAGPLGSTALERATAGDSVRSHHGDAGVTLLLSGSGRTAAVAEIADASAPGVLERRMHALWRVLVPVALRDRLLGASTATIVPDAGLHLVPFDALVITPRSAQRATSYWLDLGPAVRYAASATSLLDLGARHAAHPLAAAAVLSVSDPAFATSGENRWKPLPGTRRETDAIRAAFAPRPVAALEGDAATEPAVRESLKGRGIVHFATHGFVSERRSNLLAGLALAPSPGGGRGTEDDGLLQLFEIYGLDLDCDLVILSACETARGTRVAGEGVFALSRGFHAAGVARVIASLWPVNDASTAELMGAMFRHATSEAVSHGPPDWTRLLRDAKRSVRSHAETAEPFYWAPFVLSGAR